MGKKMVDSESRNEEYKPFTDEEKAEILKKLTPGAQPPTTEGGWAVLASRGVLKEGWEREKVPLPD